MSMLPRLVLNTVTLLRQAWLNATSSTRNIDQECGYPTVISPADYWSKYLRGDIAARVIEVLPDGCWEEVPEVYETEDKEQTEFEKRFDEVERNTHLMAGLHRADVLSGVGRFGILLLGLNDGGELRDPAPGINERGEQEGSPNLDLLYVRPLSEDCVTIEALEPDPSNPRFGLPTMYNVTFETADVAGTGSTASSMKAKVHWSRVIHLVDNRANSDVYGMPRLERVYNRVLDIHKIVGGSGEMFWKGGFPGLSVETPPNLTEDITIDEEATKEQMEAYMNGLQRYIATIGMSVKSLAPQIADPKSHFEVQIRLLSIAINVPWRVLMGSEQAQLASEQDTRNWYRRLTRRRKMYLNPFVIDPVVERLIMFGVLPETEEWTVEWPDYNTPTDEQRAEVAGKQTDALAKYVQSGADQLMGPYHFLTLIMGLEDEEAEAIIEEAEERAADMEEEEAARLDEALQREREMQQQAKLEQERAALAQGN